MVQSNTPDRVEKRLRNSSPLRARSGKKRGSKLVTDGELPLREAISVPQVETEEWNAISNNSRKQYDKAWNGWARYCQNLNPDPLDRSTDLGQTFQNYIYLKIKDDYAVSTINLIFTALKKTYGCLDGFGRADWNPPTGCDLGSGNPVLTSAASNMRAAFGRESKEKNEFLKPKSRSVTLEQLALV